MLEKIDHIGIAVKNLDVQLKFYTDIMGLECIGIQEVSDQQVRLAIIPIESVRIELLESTSPDGSIARFIEKRGEGIHHIAYQVEDLAGNLKLIEERGIQLIDKEPKTGADGHKIVFLHPKSTYGVLTELCE